MAATATLYREHKLATADAIVYATAQDQLASTTATTAAASGPSTAPRRWNRACRRVD